MKYTELSIESLKDRILHTRTEDQPLEKAKMTGVLAKKYRHQDDYEKARVHYTAKITILTEYLAKKSVTHTLQRDITSDIIATKLDLCLSQKQAQDYSAASKTLDEVEDQSNRVLSDELGVRAQLLRVQLMMQAKLYGPARVLIAEAKLTSLRIDSQFSIECLMTEAKLQCKSGEDENAKKNYKLAHQKSKALLKTSITRGTILRHCNILFNISRIYSKENAYQKTVASLKSALKTFQKLPLVFTEETHTVCQFRCELARVYALMGEFSHAIIELTQVYNVNLNILRTEASSFHSLDLFEIIEMSKKLSRWYLRLGKESHAIKPLLAAVSVLNAHPQLQLSLLNTALLYEKTFPSEKENARVLADLHTHASEILQSLRPPHVHTALRHMAKAVQLFSTPARLKAESVLLKQYHDAFHHWSKERVMQWEYCLDQYNSLSQSWLQFTEAHPDDFFHASKTNHILPASQRIEFSMLLTRMYCLLDQEYQNTMTQVFPKKRKHLYFPVALSEKQLQKYWKKQGCWDEPPRPGYITDSPLGFLHPYFSTLKQAISQHQPFTKEQWLIHLCAICNFSKHVHIGVQALPTQVTQERRGLIHRRYTGIKVGVTRMNSKVHPLSFLHITENEDSSRELYLCLTHSGLITPVESSDPEVAEVNELPCVKDYITTLSLPDGQSACSKSVKTYSSLVSDAIKTSSLQDNIIFPITTMLLNFKAQENGLAEASMLIDIDQLISQSLLGIQSVIHSLVQFQQPQAVAAEPATYTKSGSTALTFDELEKEYATLLVRLGEPVNKTIGMIRLARSHLTKIINTLSLRNDFTSISTYLKQAKLSLPSYILHEQYDRILRLTGDHFPHPHLSKEPPLILSCKTLLDDDLYARLMYAQKNTYTVLPILYLTETPGKRVNILISTFITLQFVLDQAFTRLMSRAMGKSRLCVFPQHTKRLKHFLKKLTNIKPDLDTTELQTEYELSKRWRTQTTAPTLQAKHQNIQPFITMAANVLSRKIPISRLAVDSPGFCSTPTKKYATRTLKLLLEATSGTQKLACSLAKLRDEFPQQGVYAHTDSLQHSPRKSAKECSLLDPGTSAVESAVPP